MTSSHAFDEAYKKLNKEQRQAVEALDGPVMVVAGPGTGKTQILALRIANILKKTDTGASGILCLTFTNSGVTAMRKRLFDYIGSEALKVRITTFHSFAFEYVQKHYGFLDFESEPELLDEVGALSAVDAILNEHQWKYLVPRSNKTQYFRDIISCMGLLKREMITPEEFARLVEEEEKSILENPENISSRGASKGSLKKEAEKKLESLKRTGEVARFYELYEKYKHEHEYVDYDDVLKLLVYLVTEYEDVAHEFRENFLYVLVDEHQDSSGIQNQFLERVWGSVEKPNIFVVGDDRQLIYGFGGASLDYFQNFSQVFTGAEHITLIDNYRSSQPILDLADELLESSLADGKLVSQSTGGEAVTLYETGYPRDEILLAGIYFKKQIENGIQSSECALLLPKNAHVRSALAVLRDMGIPVANSGYIDLFSSYDAQILRTVLRIVNNPYDGASLAEYILSSYSGIPILEAHTLLHTLDTRKLSLEMLRVQAQETTDLFSTTNPLVQVVARLSDWISYNQSHSVYEVLQYIGEALLLRDVTDHHTLVSRAEIVRTCLHVALMRTSGDAHLTLEEYLTYFDRLAEYGEHIPVAVFGIDEGVRVMTMHASKGLEFNHVWIAHMDEKSLTSGKRNAFVLPESIQALVEEKDELAVRRQVYVALTRARKTCTLSYALESHSGRDLECAHILADISDHLLLKKSEKESSEILMSDGPVALVTSKHVESEKVDRTELARIVLDQYEKTKVSVTLLNNFFECPWKWYFRNLLQLPEAKTESLIFGSVVHACIENILDHTEAPSADEINAYIFSALDANAVFDEKERTEKYEEVLQILRKWIEARFNDIAPSRLSERSLSYKDPSHPHLTMYGKIDLIENLTDTDVRVTDFKTGSLKSVADIERHDEEGRLSSYLRQLAMYSYLIMGSEKNTNVSASSLEFIEHGEDSKSLYTTTIVPDQIALLKKDIREYDELLRTGTWIDRPCYHKSYGKDEECPYCVRAKRIY